MKISDLIEQLTKIQAEHGDMKVIKVMGERWDCYNDEPSDYILHEEVAREYIQLTHLLHDGSDYPSLELNDGEHIYDSKEKVLAI